MTGERKTERKTDLTLSDVVMPGKKDLDGEKLKRYILDNFNDAKKSDSDFVISTSIWSGMVVNKGEFALVEANQEARLISSNFAGSKRIAPTWSSTLPGNTTRIIGKFKLSDRYYGCSNRHVLNVPPGFVAKAYLGSKPVFYGEGTHIIIDESFKLHPEPAQQFVSLAGYNTIEHGNIRIVRVPPGQIAKVIIDNAPMLLPSRPAPYVFESSIFAAEFVLATNTVITHGPIKRINLPVGKALLTHLPGGMLKVFSSEDCKDGPVIINDADHRIGDEISTAAYTLQLPTPKTQRKKMEAKLSADEINFDIFKSKDGSNIGANLVVVFEIEDIRRAFGGDPKEFKGFAKMDDLLDHIETVAQSDMRNTFADCRADELFSTGRVKEKADEKSAVPSFSSSSSPAPMALPAPTAPDYRAISDRAATELSKHLRDYGIKLSMLSIVRIEHLNKEISAKIQEQAVRTAHTSADEANVHRERDIQITKARTMAEVKKIDQDAENARTEAAAMAQAKAIRISAEARAEEIRILAAARTAALQAEMDVLGKDNVVQLKMFGLFGEALKGATVCMVGDPRIPLAAPGISGYLPPRILSDSPSSRVVAGTALSVSVAPGEQKAESGPPRLT